MLLVFLSTFGYRLILFLAGTAFLCTVFYGVPPPGPDLLIILYSLCVGPWLRDGWVLWRHNRDFLLKEP